MKRPPEKELYQTLYDNSRYREHSPGEECVDKFLDYIRPRINSSILDIGCGRGLAGLAFAKLGFKVTLIDFVDNSLDAAAIEAIKDGELRFLQVDLTDKIPVSADLGFCTDVMEHIPPGSVDLVLENIFKSCRTVYFQIANFKETHGPEILGHELHISNYDLPWWSAKLVEHGRTLVMSKDIPMIQIETGERMPEGGLYEFIVTAP